MNEMKRNENIDELINELSFDQIELSEDNFENSIFNKIEKRRFERTYKRRLMQLAASVIFILNIGLWLPESTIEENTSASFETDYFNQYRIDIYTSNDQLEENE